MARGTVKVRSVNGALTVTFTTASGRTPTVYSDSALTTTQALPATVADGATGTFYFASPGAYTMSVKTASGIQIAADLNTTRVINVDHGQTTAYDYDTRLVSKDASGDSGRHSPGTDLAATYATLLRPPSTKTISYTLALADSGQVVEMSAATAQVITIPVDSAVAFPVGTEIDIVRIGAGSVTIAGVAKNLLNNPSVETDLSGWTARNGTIAQTGTPIHGTKAVRCTATGSSQAYGFFYSDGLFLRDYGLVVGDVLSARVDCVVNAGGNTTLGLRFRYGSTIIQDLFGSAVASGVAKIENRAIPAGTDNFIVLSSATSASSGDSTDYDGLMFGKGATAPAAYGDGDSADWAWVGTAHASPSGSPVVRSGVVTIPQYGRVRLRKRAANDWTVETVTAPEALTTFSRLNVGADNGQAGWTAPGTNILTYGSTALVANKAYACRFRADRDGAPIKIGFRVAVASGTDDPCDVAIFDSSMTKIGAGSGATSGKLNSTGQKTVTIPTVGVTAGNVYYAVFAANSTATLAQANVLGNAYGSASPAAEILTQTASYPLPSTLSPSVSDQGPVLWVLES